MDTQTHLHRRLLQDIDELCRKPYPNINLHVHDGDLTKFCLVLSPPGSRKLHLTISSLGNFPLEPPVINMNSAVVHPNVFGGYICATMLNKSEAYTPAYTLKSIAIQLLSFFSSDHIEQDYGNETVNLTTYREQLREDLRLRGVSDSSFEDRYEDCFTCLKCNFGVGRRQAMEQALRRQVPGANYISPTPPKATRRRRRTAAAAHDGSKNSRNGAPEDCCASDHNHGPAQSERITQIDKMPNEILLVILEKVEDFEDITNLARAWTRVSRLITEFDVLRQRELQCFVLKKTYHEVNLGVGVRSDNKSISSEFDLLSQQAYGTLRVRRSVQGVPFDWWLPLPISRPHWQRVRGYAHHTMGLLKKSDLAQHSFPTDAQTLYQFMTDIVVKLNQVEVHQQNHSSTRSVLEHASDKAIESYFHLFHLLVCLATENSAVVSTANRLLTRFRQGHCSKTDVPNLGHLLVALLISDVKVTPELRKAIVTEAITRNVVWTLKDYPQLAYREPDVVSAYRLNKTFEASRTSYRLLMFSELFRRTARPDNLPLAKVREQLFDRHGGPPPGAAAHVASEVRRLHGVNDFTHFMREMGFETIPTAANFTRFLRRTVGDSVKAGYSQESVAQWQALALRLPCDSRVGIHQICRAEFDTWRRHDGTFVLPRVPSARLNFFPRKPNNFGRGRSTGNGAGHGGGVHGRGRR